jgi:hypothetical protein
MTDSKESVQSIKSLKQDPKNARKRTAQSKFLIEESLKRYGAARSIVIDESNRILAGNGTIDAATRSGIDKIRVIETDGDEIIAVRRTGLTEDEKVGLALADNRTSDLSDARSTSHRTRRSTLVLRRRHLSAPRQRRRV